MTDGPTIQTRPIVRARLDAHPDRLGGYRIYDWLGAGGQASVYRARRIGDPDACDVALKRLHPHLAHDDPAVRSFGREARIAYLVDHPVIRRVLALCREPGELFMIMEYVHGVSLTAVLKRASATQRPLSVAGILAVVHRLGRALHYAHDLVDERGAPLGLVHRDVSPANLIVTPAGRLKLIDLGVARSQSVDHATHSGLIKGKYGYMAPEVMRNDEFDRRADVFSAGVVAWEMLTLCKLFPVRDPPVDLERIRSRPIDPPSIRNPACPDDLDAIVLRALAADPADRWASCASLADAIEDLAQRRGEPLADTAIAALVEPGAVAELAAPRSRLARGTPRSLPASQVAAPAAPPRRKPRLDRRAVAVSAVVGSCVVGVLAGQATRISTSLPPPPPPRALAPAPPRAPTPTPTSPLAAVPAPAPTVRDEPEPISPVEVDADAVTRLAGKWPRSRSSTGRYRARLCIDTTGAVMAVELLAMDAPGRTEPRIVDALLGWRYLPYREAGEPTPACFVIDARLRRSRHRG